MFCKVLHFDTLFYNISICYNNDNCYLFLYVEFLAHLSWSWRLILVSLFLLKFFHCLPLLSIIVNFPHFHFLLQNTGPISTNLEHNIIGWRGLKFVQMKGRPIFKAKYIKLLKICWYIIQKNSYQKPFGQKSCHLIVWKLIPQVV